MISTFLFTLVVPKRLQAIPTETRPSIRDRVSCTYEKKNTCIITVKQFIRYGTYLVEIIIMIYIHVKTVFRVSHYTHSAHNSNFNTFT